MKKELIIVSDLWGRNRSDWLVHFEQLLGERYDLKFYDACQLGEVDLTDYNQENLHRQFVDFGIEKAVNKLLNLEPKPKLYIGISVGGVILWRAGLLGLPIQKLVTISATRLRHETEKPNVPIQLFFGLLDEYQPDKNWFNALQVDGHFIPKGDHDIYQNSLTVAQIFNQSILK